jgi:hypothetical protein
MAETLAPAEVFLVEKHGRYQTFRLVVVLAVRVGTQVVVAVCVGSVAVYAVTANN